MPVSHLGLSVAHIPSSTSFYLAALQPLGYQFIGHQGESIGLGIKEADFFLCQEQSGAKVAPTHIAFTADSRLAVRNCYASALNAGGRPSGAPGYRNNDCSCFNAAVTDLDGHTIEFIFREAPEDDACHTVTAPSEFGYSKAGRDSVARSNYEDDRQSVATKASRAKSRAQTALDLASATSKSTKQSVTSTPIPGITRSRTEPVLSNGGNKKLVGTLLGAAAGAAVAYAMAQSERDNAREETDYARLRVSSARPSRTRSNYERSVLSRTSGRSSKPMHRDTLAIQQATYSDDDYPEVLSHYRPAPQRSRTYDAIEYAPKPASSRGNDRYSMKRSSTLPTGLPNDYLEGPKTTASSRHTSRRGSVDGQELKRHDSAVSVQSHRPRRSFDGSRRSSASKVSTVKPSRRGSVYESAVNYPIPSSKAPSYASAAERPLPASRATSYMSAAQVSLPQSRMTGGYDELAEESDGLSDMKTVVPEDSISCIDFSTKSKKSKGSSKSSSRHSSKHSEASTVRPANPTASRHSAQTLPVRSKDDYYRSRDGKRSTLSYA